MKKIRNEKLKILVVIQLHKKAKEKKENTRCSPACSLNTLHIQGPKRGWCSQPCLASHFYSVKLCRTGYDIYVAFN